MAYRGLHLCLLLGIMPTTALRLVKEYGAAGDSCECLNFAEVYRSGQARCGEGLELIGKIFGSVTPKVSDGCRDAISRSRSLFTTWDLLHDDNSDADRCSWANLLEGDAQDCNDFPNLPNSSFFPHQEHHYCTKVLPFAQSRSALQTTSWCYVSSQCNQLQGGAQINERVSWKICTPDQDQVLEDLDVPELCSLMATMDPMGKPRGLCKVAAFYAYGLGPAEWYAGMEDDEYIRDFIRIPNIWDDKRDDLALVIDAGHVYEIYGSPRNGSDFKCIRGC